MDPSAKFHANRPSNMEDNAPKTRPKTRST